MLNLCPKFQSVKKHTALLAHQSLWWFETKIYFGSSTAASTHLTLEVGSGLVVPKIQSKHGETSFSCSYLELIWGLPQYLLVLQAENACLPTLFIKSYANFLNAIIEFILYFFDIFHSVCSLSLFCYLICCFSVSVSPFFLSLYEKHF